MRAEAREEDAAGRESLHSVVVSVRDIDRAVRADCQAGRTVQLTLTAPSGAPIGLVAAVEVEHRNAVGVFVADEQPLLRVRGDTGSPHELARIVAEVAERAVVFAVYVANGDADSARRSVHGTVGHVEPSVRRDGGIGRVVEPAALHGGESDGEVVLENGGLFFDSGGGHWANLCLS